mmetsp:Transcript_14841/g.24908  ORF Transcript_14841/g.24908 Transcript_14841/m.24908 type:complete len:100 (+) Transcript_14841:135-434(+)
MDRGFPLYRSMLQQWGNEKEGRELLHFLLHLLISSCLLVLRDQASSNAQKLHRLKVDLLVYQWPGERRQRQSRISCCKWAETAFFLLGQITVMKRLSLQ